MIRIVFVSMLIVLSSIACSSREESGSLLSEIAPPATPTPSLEYTLEDIQIGAGRILPPYGITVQADFVRLRVILNSDSETVSNRLTNLQQAVTDIEQLAESDEAIQLDAVTLNQIGSDAEEKILSSVRYSGNLDSSSITLTFGSRLAVHNDSLLDSLAAFDTFLNNITLTDSLSLQATAVETRISQPENYRPQLVAKVYEELEAIQTEYGQAVSFTVTELHGPVHSLRLSDTEYYLYIEPHITVSEF